MHIPCIYYEECLNLFFITNIFALLLRCFLVIKLEPFLNLILKVEFAALVFSVFNSKE